MNSTAFHNQFDTNAKNLIEACREPLLEGPVSATEEELIGQVIMNMLGECEASMSARQKARLVLIADHMGPDWCQALYHAAVFMTRVA